MLNRSLLICIVVWISAGIVDGASTSLPNRLRGGRKLSYNSDPSEDNVTSPPVVLVPVTNSPTISPSVSPTNEPTVSPTIAPSKSPTVPPTAAPTSLPTNVHTDVPTKAPFFEREDEVPPDDTTSPTPCPLRHERQDSHCFLWIFCF